METRETIILQQLLEVNTQIAKDLALLRKLFENVAPSGHTLQVTDTYV